MRYDSTVFTKEGQEEFTITHRRLLDPLTHFFPVPSSRFTFLFIHCAELSRFRLCTSRRAMDFRWFMLLGISLTALCDRAHFRHAETLIYADEEAVVCLLDAFALDME